MKITVIITVLNEMKTIGYFVRSLYHQSRKADEVIVVDGGSTDGTCHYLQMFKWIRVIQDPCCNIKYHPSPVARGRNIAICHASGDVILVTDAGCIMDWGWIEAMAERFESGAEAVCGKIEIGGHGLYPRLLRRIVNFNIQDPPSRNVGFRKSLWEKVGGYPEVSLTAEDTLFNKLIGYTYEPRAVVTWLPPKFKGFLRDAYNYARGDSISRLRRSWYARMVLKHLLFPIYWPYLIYKYGLAAFLKVPLDAVRVWGYFTTRQFLERNFIWFVAIAIIPIWVLVIYFAIAG